MYSTLSQFRCEIRSNPTLFFFLESKRSHEHLQWEWSPECKWLIIVDDVADGNRRGHDKRITDHSPATTHNNGFAACLTMVWNCDELTEVLHGVHSVELKQQRGQNMGAARDKLFKKCGACNQNEIRQFSSTMY